MFEQDSQRLLFKDSWLPLQMGILELPFPTNVCVGVAGTDAKESNDRSRFGRGGRQSKEPLLGEGLSRFGGNDVSLCRTGFTLLASRRGLGGMGGGVFFLGVFDESKHGEEASRINFLGPFTEGSRPFCTGNGILERTGRERHEREEDPLPPPWEWYHWDELRDSKSEWSVVTDWMAPAKMFCTSAPFGECGTLSYSMWDNARRNSPRLFSAMIDQNMS